MNEEILPRTASGVNDASDSMESTYDGPETPSSPLPRTSSGVNAAADTADPVDAKRIVPNLASLVPEEQVVPNLAHLLPEKDAIAEQATEMLQKFRENPDLTPYNPQSKTVAELVLGLRELEKQAINHKTFAQRAGATLSPLLSGETWKKGKDAFMAPIHKALDKEQAKLADFQADPTLMKSIKYSLESLRDDTTGAVKGVMGLFPLAADLISSGAQAIGGTMLGAVSKDAELEFDADLNTATDILHGAFSNASHGIDKNTGSDPESLSTVVSENVAPLLLPMPGAAKLAGAIPRLVENSPKWIARAEAKALQAASIVTPLAGKTAKAAALGGIGAAIGHGLADTATTALELAGVLLGFKGNKGWVTSMIQSKFSDAAKAAKIIAESPEGTRAIDAIWKDAEKSAQTIKEEASFLRSKLSPEEQAMLDERASTGEFKVRDENLSSKARKVRAAESDAVEASKKAALFRNQADSKRLMDNLVRVGLSTGAHAAEGAAIGAAISGASSATGEKDALAPGIIVGGGLGLAGGAMRLPSEVRAAGRDVNYNKLLRSGETALPENHPLYDKSESAIKGRSKAEQDYIRVNSGLAKARGARVIPLSGADFVEALQSHGIDVDPSNPPAGEYHGPSKTAYINVDHLDSGVVPHEITHAIDQASGLSENGAFSKAFDAMMSSDNPKIRQQVEEARRKYEERLNANLKPGSKPVILSDRGLKSEIAADLGSDLIHEIRPEGLYGGRSVIQRIGEHLRNIGNKLPGDKTGKTNTFGFPVTPDMRSALLDELYAAGRAASKGSRNEPIPYTEQSSPRPPAPDASNGGAGRSSVTWREFSESKMAEYMQSEGSHGAAMKRLGKEWAERKSSVEKTGRDFQQTEATNDAKATAMAAAKALGISDPEAKVDAAIADLVKEGATEIKPEDVVKRATQRSVPKQDLGDVSVAAQPSSSMMPASRSDTIDRPASKIGDMIFPGIPRQAKAAAKQYGLSDVEIESTHKPGFVTEGGKWLNPEEARKLGEDTGQLPEGKTGSLTPQDLTDERRFMPSSPNQLKVQKDGTQKAWIDRKGNVIPLTGGHPEYANSNLKSMGLKGKITDAGDSKLAATNAGNTRVNISNGTMMVEVAESQFPKVRDAIRNLAHENLDGITRIDVSLLNDKGMTVGGEEANIYRDPKKLDSMEIWGGEKKGRMSDVMLERNKLPAGSMFNSPDAQFMPAVKKAQQSAEDYVKSSGVGRILPPSNAKVDVEKARQIAKDYEALPKSDNSPETKQSYDTFVKEVDAQYRHAVDSGIKFEFTKDDPYKSSADMMHDVEKNGRLKVYTGGDDHPFLGSSTRDESGLTANDKFRAVHDLYGHASEGNQFGPQGEERAWMKHAAMFSDEARPAMTAETRGQNSWTNYGPHMFDENGWKGDKSHPDYIPPSERPFAEQKASLLPKEHSDVPTETPNSSPTHPLASLEGPVGSTQPDAPKAGPSVDSPPWVHEYFDLDKKDLAGTITPEEAKRMDELHQRAEKEYGSYDNFYKAHGGKQYNAENLFTSDIRDTKAANVQDTRQYMPSPALEREAERLGLAYKGDMGEGKLHLYNDPVTKSTIAIKHDAERGELQKKLQDTRDKFKGALGDVNFMPSSPSDRSVTDALSSDKRGFVGKHRDLPKGTRIGVRIDIPAYERDGTYVQTVHEMAKGSTVGKRIGYDGMVSVDNPTFMSNERGAEKIRDGSPKFPVATVEGEYNPSREIPKNLDEWEPVGYNPKNHSYFYSKNSGEPVVSGDRAVSLGNTVYVEHPSFGNKEDFLFMPSMREGFYSPLEKHLEEKMPNRTSPEQLSGMLAKGGIKKAEMEFSGINDLIDQAKKEGRSITKEEALDFVRANTPEIKEVVKGAQNKNISWDKDSDDYGNQWLNLYDNHSKKSIARVIVRGEGKYELVAENGKTVFGNHEGKYSDLDEAKSDAEQLAQPVGQTKWADRSDLNLPGGENPRELLITLPEAPTSSWYAVDKYGKQVGNSSFGSKEEAQAAAGQRGYTTPSSINPKNYKDVHWDEPNVVAHLRVNDRTLADGSTQLFMEESQSGIGQKIRSLEKKAQEGSASEADVQELDRLKKITPFQGEAWKKLTLRSLIKHAVEGGYDSVGWTTGEQQAARYDLSKHLDNVKSAKNPDGTFSIWSTDKSGENVFQLSSVKESEIENHVGKDLAGKIISESPSNGDPKVFSGVDLKIGGSGMKGFYDKELVNIANDIGKKFGAKVEKSNIPTDESNVTERGLYTSPLPDGSGYMIKDREGNVVVEDAGGYSESGKKLKELQKLTRNQEEVHSLKITPEMRDSISNEGQPMFMPSPLGEAKGKVSREGKISYETEEVFWNSDFPKLLRATGLQVSAKNEKLINKAAEQSIEDVQKFMKDNPKFQNYYDEDFKTVHRDLSEYLGREATPDEMAVFQIANGFTSPNTGLKSNTGDAMNVLDHWVKNGNLDAIKMGVSPKGNRVIAESPFEISGNTNSTKAFTLTILNQLAKELGGPAKVAEHLKESVTRKELEEFNASLGYKGKVGKMGYIQRVVQEATGQKELIPRAFVFGPKVGAYTLNLIGEHRYTTLDIWESRFVRSQFKGLFKEGDGLPGTDAEHELFTKFAREFNSEFAKQTGLNLSPAALQAARWFYMLDTAKQAGYTGTTTNKTISEYTKGHIEARRNSKISDIHVDNLESLPDNPF